MRPARDFRRIASNFCLRGGLGVRVKIAVGSVQPFIASVGIKERAAGEVVGGGEEGEGKLFVEGIVGLVERDSAIASVLGLDGVDEVDVENFLIALEGVPSLKFNLRRRQAGVFGLLYYHIILLINHWAGSSGLAPSNKNNNYG